MNEENKFRIKKYNQTAAKCRPKKLVRGVKIGTKFGPPTKQCQKFVKKYKIL